MGNGLLAQTVQVFLPATAEPLRPTTLNESALPWRALAATPSRTPVSFGTVLGSGEASPFADAALVDWVLCDGAGAGAGEVSDVDLVMDVGLVVVVLTVVAVPPHAESATLSTPAITMAASRVSRTTRIGADGILI